MWEAIETYMARKQPLIIIAGADYGQGILPAGTGAAKGVALAGVEAIVAEGFEGCTEYDLIGMGIAAAAVRVRALPARRCKLTAPRRLSVQGQPRTGGLA